MDCDAAERRRGDEEERGEERGFARRGARAWAAAVGFGLLGAVALVFTREVGQGTARWSSLAAPSSVGATAENRNVRESAVMKAYDAVQRDMAKLQADLDRAKALKDPATGEIGGDEVRQAIADDYAQIKRDTETQVHPDLGTFDHKFFRAD